MGYNSVIKKVTQMIFSSVVVLCFLAFCFEDKVKVITEQYQESPNKQYFITQVVMTIFLCVLCGEGLVKLAYLIPRWLKK